MKAYNILNLGAGIQSSRVLLGMCQGELPKPDAAIFADTQWEPKAVYANVEFLRSECDKAGIPLLVVTAGPIREEILQFMRSRTHTARKRYASIPLFIRNPDGSVGRMKRQCTTEYKIEVIEEAIRRQILGLKPRQRVPKGVLVRQWFGISTDEASRGAYPGRMQQVEVQIGIDLLGNPLTQKRGIWKPVPWRENVYPLLGQVWLPDRSIREEKFLSRPENRQDCLAWLGKHYPGRTFPRSACLGCPFRSNSEWRDMRDNRPDEWADACEFDDLQRQPDAASASERALLVGTPYLHRQLVPLRLVNLDGDGERGGGCGALYDGQDGLCDV